MSATSLRKAIEEDRPLKVAFYQGVIHEQPTESTPATGGDTMIFSTVADCVPAVIDQDPRDTLVATSLDWADALLAADSQSSPSDLNTMARTITRLEIRILFLRQSLVDIAILQ